MTVLFRIIQPAALTQFQDLGRFGHMALGFPQSGPMDELAFAANNRLLDNPENAVQLEIAPGGVILAVLGEATIALAGAYAHPTLDGKPLVNFHSHRVRGGQELRMGFPRSGQYAYLAVKGGFRVPLFLGSGATCARIGIFPQRLCRGSVLESAADERFAREQGIPRREIPDYRDDTFNVLPSYQYPEFSEAIRARFVAQRYRVRMTDRMGTLLCGGTPLSFAGGEPLSEGIVPGAIQVSNEGQPIVLHKDAQTVGGYPKIGVLTAESRSRLAQCPSGREVRFRFV